MFMSNEPRTADVNADGVDDMLGPTPPELRAEGEFEAMLRKRLAELGEKVPTPQSLSIREAAGRSLMEDMRDMNLNELQATLAEAQKLKFHPGAKEFMRLIEIQMAERRAESDTPNDAPFEPSPAPYTYREGDSPDPISGEADEAVATVSTYAPIQVPKKPVSHLPLVIVSVIFITVVGGAVFISQTKESTLDIPVRTAPLINGQSSALFQVDYGKAGMYAAYVPEQKITYSAGTGAPAKAVSWLVCDDKGEFVMMIPLAMQENIEDADLRSRRWKSSGAPALPPGEYRVTVRAESTQDDIAIKSFIFDPIRGVQTDAPPPECKAHPAGI